MIDEIIGWLKSGASLGDGIRLFALCRGERHPFIDLITHNHQVCYPILVAELAAEANVTPEQLEQFRRRKGSFRDNWPFLADPNCPGELKILAADKISAYWNYVNAHEALFDCTSLEESAATAKEVLENYKENRAIIAEFVYYGEHGHVLGKHPIFKEMKDMQALRKLNPVELIKLEAQLTHNIWRTETEIKKNKKPHLRTERERRLRTKKRQLKEVERLIAAIK